MAVISWDGSGDRHFETGVKNCVLYVPDSSGDYKVSEAWNGITAITESPSGAEETALWADNQKYASMRSAEEFGGTIEAYTYPDLFAQCNGEAELVAGKGVTMGQQARKVFGLCYRTEIGNDVDGNAHGYKLHLVYGCTCSPSERSYSTINDSPEAITFSWEFTSTPITIASLNKSTSILTVDSTVIPSAKLTALENLLYGTASDDPELPTPEDVITLLNAT